MLLNIESLFFEIKNLLSSDEVIKKLLFYNDSDALEKVTPTLADVESHFFIKPIIYVYEDSPEANINNFLSIGYVKGTPLEGSTRHMLKISVASERRLWELKDNKIRPLRIANKVIEKINKRKFGPATILKLDDIREVHFSNDLVGYILLFELWDEQGDIVNEF